MDSLMWERVLYCLEMEIRGAQHKFPGNEKMIAVTGEEFGEVCNAFIEHWRGKVPASHVFKECIQLAAMALSLAIEGDAEYPYAYDYECYKDFTPTGGGPLAELEARVG